MARKSGKPDREEKKVTPPQTGSDADAEVVKPRKQVPGKGRVEEMVVPKPTKKASPRSKMDGRVPSPRDQDDQDESKPDGQMPSPQSQADLTKAVNRDARPVSRLTGEPLSELFERGYVSPPNPDPDWGRGRAVREDGDAATAAPRRYRAPILRVPGGERLSLALAAFRLGRLGIAMTAEAETLWDDLVRRQLGNMSHDGSFTLIPRATTQLLEARRALIDVIPPHVYDRLDRIVEQFAEFNRSTIDRYEKGEFVPLTFENRRPPWERLAFELETASSQAFESSHSLRLLFDLGSVFGEFSVMTNNYFSSLLNDDSDEAELWPTPVPSAGRAATDRARHPRKSPPEPVSRSKEPDPFPEIGKITRLASSLPEAILGRSRLLKSLAAIAGNYGRLGEEKAFKRYFNENRDCWMDDSRTHASRATAKTVLPIEGPDGNPFRMPPVKRRESLKDAIRRIDVEQVRLVEADLARIADDFWKIAKASAANPAGLPSSKPRWDKPARKLWFRGIGTEKLRDDAKTAIPILTGFEECQWATRVDSPFPGGGKATSGHKLVNGVKTLNRFAKGLGIHFDNIGTEAVTWSED